MSSLKHISEKLISFFFQTANKMGDVGADPMASLVAAGGVAQVAAAAAAAAKAEKLANKPKIAFEVRPFTKESLEKINLRTSNLIRDYGFLPKRKPNLLDGAELPAKVWIF